MGDSVVAGSSLLQTQAEKVHREQHRKIKHHQHKQLHLLRQRQAAAPTDTDTTTTVSVIQQIVVDTSGSTIATVIVDPAASTVPASVPTPVTAPAAPLTTSPPVASVIPAVASPALSTTGLLSTGAVGANNETDPSVTSTLSSLSPSQASVLASALSLTSKPGSAANSTKSLTSSSFHTANSVSNHTFASTLTALKSSFGSDSSQTTTLYSTTSIAGFQSVSTTSSLSTSTDAAGNLIVGGVPVATGGSSPTSTSAATGSGDDSNSGSNSSTPPTPILVGSVVGSIAGAAFIIFVLLFLLRWYKRSRRGLLSLNRGDGLGPAAITSRNGGDPSQSGGMIERSIPFAIPAALASLTGRNKRASHIPAQSASSTAGSERGFYRVSGRKLPSVLQSGGDGYGGGLGERPMFGHPNTLSGTSFYRDSQGFHGGQGTGISGDRDSGIPVMRPGPARTPVTQQGAFASPPKQSPFNDSPFDSPPPPPRRPDVLGRSHPSQDGSHGSRFTEELV